MLEPGTCHNRGVHCGYRRGAVVCTRDARPVGGVGRRDGDDEFWWGHTVVVDDEGRELRGLLGFGAVATSGTGSLDRSPKARHRVGTGGSRQPARARARIVQWLGLPSGAFLSGIGDGTLDNTPTPTVIAQHLFADRHLSASDASAIAELVEEMYKQLAVERPSLTVHLRSSQTFRKEAGNLLAGILHEMQTALENER